MVTQFVGFMGAARHPGGLPPMLAGTLGGLLTTWVTFTPCFLWIFLGAPFSERLRFNRALGAAMAAITAAVVGVILNLAIWFGLHTLFGSVREVRAGPIALDVPVFASLNLPALVLTAAAMVAIFRFRIGPLWVILGCALAGTAYWLLLRAA
jgi:chromate transporter